MRIMAIDLGKSKSVCCVYDSASDEHSFKTIETKPEVLAHRLALFAPDRVDIETCPPAEWMGDLVRSQGFELEVANPAHWRVQLVVSVRG